MRTELTFGCKNMDIMDHGGDLEKYPDCCGLDQARETGGRVSAHSTLEPPPGCIKSGQKLAKEHDG